LTKPEQLDPASYAGLAGDIWAVVSRLQIANMDALELVGYSRRAMRAGALFPLPTRQLRTAVRRLSEIELAMRGLHLLKEWVNHPRRVPPFFGRTPLELLIAESDEGFGQVIEFLTELTANRRIR
jgi:hypothetical protein